MADNMSNDFSKKMVKMYPDYIGTKKDEVPTERNAVILSFTNSKGGCAKTTSACITAEMEAVIGKKVLLIDLDAQCNATNIFGLRNFNGSADYVRMFVDPTLTKDEILSYVMPVNVDEEGNYTKLDYLSNIYMIPGDKELNFIVGSELLRALDKNSNSYFTLKRNLDKIRDEFDYIIIDTMPTINPINRAIFIALDEYFIPVSMDGNSLEGVIDIEGCLSDIENTYGIRPINRGIFLTRINKAARNALNAITDIYANNFEDVFRATYITQAAKTSLANINFLPDFYTHVQSRAKDDAVINDYSVLLYECGMINIKEKKLIDGYSLPRVDKKVGKKDFYGNAEPVEG